MRILILHGDTRNTEQGAGGGGESTLQDQARALRGRGHEVFWWYGQEPIEDSYRRFKPDVCHVMTLVDGLTPERNATHDLTKAQWLLEQGAVVLWQLNDYWPFCQSRMLLDGVNPCPAVDGTCDHSCGLDVPRRYAETLNRCHVVALNETSAAIYQRHGINVQSIVHLGIDTDLFRPDPVQRTPEPSVWHHTAWWPYATKGAHIIQEAVKGKEWGISVISGQPRHIVADLLKRAHIHVFPSCYQETWGLSLTEAMASGCACIASDVAGARAQINHGINGWLIEPHNPGKLAGAIELLLDDEGLRTRLGAAARVYAESHCSLDAMARRWELAYAQAAEVFHAE